ncbi:GTP cyclohydrolase II RibA [Rhodospirillum sp. A1_3_36]|uniref:GTP cyclohydrolase II RibA n=1 Tax=Rhodospirillum sp. A1_3_36 TaxID=3391666 RepID=UPI0039A77D95
MEQAVQGDFQFSSPTMEVERAVAELRFGRPVILRDGPRHLAVLALDCVAPQVYDRFAASVDNRHSLLLTAERASRLGLLAGHDIAVPMAGLSFDAASTHAYALHGPAPVTWRLADPLMSATTELARLALLLPAMVCADVGEVASRFAACSVLSKDGLFAINGGGQTFTQIARTRVPLKEIGDADFVVFRGGLAQRDQVAIVIGNPDLRRPVPVRIHSSCLTGDLYGSLKCDCGDQLRNGLSQLKQEGGGVLIYLDQEGRGTGIGAKMRAYGYQHLGLDTIDADSELGLSSDHRRYEAAAAILRLLGMTEVIAYTNNPTKIAALRAGNIRVEGWVPVVGTVTAENVSYLRTKTVRAGHMFNLEALVVEE